MQFKKIAAIAGSALMAGLSLAAPVLATSVTKLSDINKLVSVTGTTPSYPMFVIGATAATSDVAGAVDVAVNLASQAVVTTQVATSGSGVSITGGASMATPTNPLTMWDNFASSKQVLTANDLPSLLGTGTYVDAGSISAPYSQYLSFNNTNTSGQIVYDTDSGAGQTQPALGLKFTSNNQIYNYQLAFTKQISETITNSVVTNMVNTQLNIMGNTWTITNALVNSVGDLDLTMLAGQNSQTVTTEAPATYTVGSSTYTVTLVAVGTINGQAAVTLTVSGGTLAAPQTLQILSGGTKALPDGTLIGVTSIFSTTKTGAIDSATVFVGANKLEMEDTALADTNYYAGVKLNGNTVNDVTVRMTGNSTGTASGTLTLNSIEVQWKPSTDQFVTSGSSLTDPAFGGFKIFFGGIAPALDDTTNREPITITPSGTTAAISFKDAAGNNLNQNFVQSTATNTVGLADASGAVIHVLEGEAVVQNAYAVLSQNSYASSGQNPFGHVIKALSIQSSATATSQFQDVASGSTIQVTGGNTTMYLDGQAYKVCVLNAGASVEFTWGSTAGYCDPGSSIDVFPAIQTSKGGWVALATPVTITMPASNATTLNLPTGALVVNMTDGTGIGAKTVGTYGKYVTAVATASTMTVKMADYGGLVYSTPSVMVIEANDKNQNRNTLTLNMTGDGTYNRVDIPTAPVFSSSKTAQSTVSGTTLNKYVDKFGTYVTWDSTLPGTFSISYPSSQSIAAVGVGASPSSSNGGAGGSVTTQTVIPIKTDVVKLDSEVTSADESANDLILVGGPCINTLVAQLATANKFPYTCANWPGKNFGRIQVIADAFATGKTALVIAGTTAADTDLAARLVQTGLPSASATQSASAAVEVTGSATSPVYS